MGWDPSQTKKSMRPTCPFVLRISPMAACKIELYREWDPFPMTADRNYLSGSNATNNGHKSTFGNLQSEIIQHKRLFVVSFGGLNNVVHCFTGKHGCIFTCLLFLGLFRQWRRVAKSPGIAWMHLSFVRRLANAFPCKITVDVKSEFMVPVDQVGVTEFFCC